MTLISLFLGFFGIIIFAGILKLMHEFHELIIGFMMLGGAGLIAYWLGQSILMAFHIIPYPAIQCAVAC